MTAGAVTPSIARSERLVKVERAALFLLAMIVVVFMAVYWPAWQYPTIVSDSNIDAAFFAYAGERVRHGAVPYVDFWDHKPPVVFYINAGALMLSQGALWGPWLASVGALLLAVYLAYSTMHRLFGSGAALLGCAVQVTAMLRVTPVNMTEGYALPIVWATAGLAIRVLVSMTDATASPRADSGYWWRSGMLLGALGVLAFLLRANLIAAAVATGVAWSVIAMRVGAWDRLVKLFGGAVGAAIITTAVLLAPLARRDGLAAFWEEAFRYNFVYAHAPVGLKLRSALLVLPDVTTYGSLVLPLAAWIAAVALVVRRRVEFAGTTAVPEGYRASLTTAALFAAVWLPLELLMAMTSGRAYGHYYAVPMPALSFLTAFGAAWAMCNLSNGEPHARRQGRRAMTALAMAMVVPAVLVTAVRLRDRASPRARVDQVSATAAAIQSRVPEGEPVLIWGHAADVYLAADRPAASRFIYPLPLLTPGYATPAMVAGFVEEIRRAAPRVIVDATAGVIIGEMLVPPLDSWNGNWRFPEDTGPMVWWSMTPAMRAFYDYVHAHYRATMQIGALKWTLYERMR